MGPVFSTKFFSAAITAGRVKSSQKISISWRSSSRGMGLMNLFAAMRAAESNFVIWAAVHCASLRDRTSTRLNSSHVPESRMPSSACNDTATTEIYALSVHDALPSWLDESLCGDARGRVEFCDLGGG